LNYNQWADSIDWARFTQEVVAKMEAVGARYYLKKDLQIYR